MDLTEYISSGMKAEDVFRVEKQYSAAYVGSGSLDVLATPSMIAFVERVALKMLANSLPPELSSVGIWVEARHLAPTPMNALVRVQCQVTDVDDARVTFLAQLWDEHEQIGEVQHQRVVIDVARFMRRVDLKRAGS